jgi:glycosyl hydrolase family 42 (putative beta-galactosidase)
VIGYLREIREAIRKTRDVPVLFNDTSLLSRREWRSRGFPVVDGFMFEAGEIPGEKLFNLALGHSTGKVIWTYVGTHTQYNREHLKNERVRGWFSYPVESEELLIDGATGLAGGAGLIYWGLSRFFYMPERPLRYEAGRYVKEIFDWADENRELLLSTQPAPVAGILVGSQTVDWYKAEHFVLGAYPNAYNGAFQLLKDSSYDAEPFLDYAMTAETLRRYKLVFAPNAACLSDAQCDLLRAYVEGGGRLVATHFTSAADEYGRGRNDVALADLLGVRLVSAAPSRDRTSISGCRQGQSWFRKIPRSRSSKPLPARRSWARRWTAAAAGRWGQPSYPARWARVKSSISRRAWRPSTTRPA